MLWVQLVHNPKSSYEAFLCFWHDSGRSCIFKHVYVLQKCQSEATNIAQNPEDALAELMELGPLGIPQSSSLDASSDPFASPLVTQAFTDVPAMSTGKHCQCHSLLEDANI